MQMWFWQRPSQHWLFRRHRSRDPKQVNCSLSSNGATQPSKIIVRITKTKVKRMCIIMIFTGVLMLSKRNSLNGC